jgi:hypothetical protein
VKKIKDNELARITHKLREIERGKNKKSDNTTHTDLLRHMFGHHGHEFTSQTEEAEPLFTSDGKVSTFAQE